MKGTLGFLEHFSYTKGKGYQVLKILLPRNILLEIMDCEQFLSLPRLRWGFFKISYYHPIQPGRGRWNCLEVTRLRKSALLKEFTSNFQLSSVHSSFLFCSGSFWSYCEKKTLQWPSWTLTSLPFFSFFLPWIFKAIWRALHQPEFQLERENAESTRVWVCIEGDL